MLLMSKKQRKIFVRTGKKLTTTAINIWRITDGKIAEKELAVVDLLDFYKQLGVIEYTEKGKKLIPE